MRIFILILITFLYAGLSPASEKGIFIELRDLATGRKIISQSSTQGDLIILTWNNSLFHLKVTETYTIRDVFIEQTSVTFHDPKGNPPPAIRPGEVDDFYHTGGPFRTEGISRQFKKIIFRIGEYGDPVLKIGENSIRLKEEVGFGGAVVLEVKEN
ncbi:MAG: hypothetical protein N3D15_09075 [Syntrophorhabdaceae bacterium]|nr:hypothetical protein [Syntrophorhabdaceae bacterium]